MQNEAIYSDLIKVLLTREDVNKLLWEIGVLRESLFKTDAGAFANILKSQVRKQVADVIEKYISAGDRVALLDFLEEKFKETPDIKLTLAFDPTQETIQKVSKWVKMSVGDVLIDYKVDRSIIGGAIVEYGGKIGDFSVKKLLS